MSSAPPPPHPVVQSQTLPAPLCPRRDTGALPCVLCGSGREPVGGLGLREPAGAVALLPPRDPEHRRLGSPEPLCVSSWVCQLRVEQTQIPLRGPGLPSRRPQASPGRSPSTGSQPGSPLCLRRGHHSGLPTLKSPAAPGRDGPTARQASRRPWGPVLPSVAPGLVPETVTRFLQSQPCIGGDA